MPFPLRFPPVAACLLACLTGSVWGQTQAPETLVDSLTALSRVQPIAESQVRIDSIATSSVSYSMLTDSLSGRADTLARSTQRRRTGLLLSSSLLTLGATYVYLEKRWWNDGYTSMHLDDGRDSRYASNIDKFGHLLGGIFTADVYYGGFRWAGMSQRRAEWYALGATAFVQLSIEFKDGFSPRYGFSWADVVAGTAGGFWPMLRNRSAFIRNSQFKFSYWQRTDKYFEHRGIQPQAFSIDDYINQTYWFSFSPTHLLGSRFTQKWPDWLQFSVGVGLEADTWSPTRNGEGGRWEIYLAPDIDLVKLFKPKKTLMRSVLRILNYMKVPMPTLQLGPTPKLWGLYF